MPLELVLLFLPCLLSMDLVFSECPVYIGIYTATLLSLYFGPWLLLFLYLVFKHSCSSTSSTSLLWNVSTELFIGLIFPMNSISGSFSTFIPLLISSFTFYSLPYFIQLFVFTAMSLMFSLIFLNIFKIIL